MFHDFCFFAWSLWTLLCRRYNAFTTWVLSSSLTELRLRSLFAPFTLRCQFPCHFAYFTLHPSILHEKHRPTRLLLIFRSLTQVTLMHASPALQLTLGHAQTGGCTRSYFLRKKFARGPRSHFIRVSELARLPFHSSSPSLTWEGLPEVRHKLSVGTDSFLERFPSHSADSSLLRHWLSHHLRSLGRSGRSPYRTVSSDKSKLDSGVAFPCRRPHDPSCQSQSLWSLFHSSIGEFAPMLSDGSRRTPAYSDQSQRFHHRMTSCSLVLVALIRCCDRNGTLSIRIDLPFLHIDSFPAFQLRCTYDSNTFLLDAWTIFKFHSLRESWRPACLRLRSARLTK
jgi:hypothetical protein